MAGWPRSRPRRSTILGHGLGFPGRGGAVPRWPHSPSSSSNTGHNVNAGRRRYRNVSATHIQSRRLDGVVPHAVCRGQTRKQKTRKKSLPVSGSGCVCQHGPRLAQRLSAAVGTRMTGKDVVEGCSSVWKREEKGHSVPRTKIGRAVDRNTTADATRHTVGRVARPEIRR